MKRLIKADLAAILRLAGEYRFLAVIGEEELAGLADAGLGENRTTVQGVADCIFEEEDGIVIVDYKTDRIRPDAVPERTAYYAAQLRAYAGAMARITGRPVCRRTLYFLHCGCSADVPETDA